MRYNVFRLWVFVPLLTILVLFSCIGEDLSGCPTEEVTLLLGFRFTPEDDNDTQGSDVSCLDIFVFDESGIYLESFRDNNPRMDDDDYRLSLSLPAGFYSFVAWENTDADIYTIAPEPFVRGITRIEEARLSFARPTDNTITQLISHLFHGHLSRVEVTGVAGQVLFIPIVQNTYTVNLDVAGLGADVPSCLAIISDDHSDYDFINAPITSLPLFYSGAFNTSGTLRHTVLRTLRLMEHSATRLEVCTVDGSTLYDASLIDLIRSAATSAGKFMDLDRVHHYNIRLEFDAAYGTVTVTVNGWNADSQDYDIHPQS